MSEIMPIPPAPPLLTPQRVEREKERKNENPRHPPRCEQPSPPPDDGAVPHIDEVV